MRRFLPALLLVGLIAWPKTAQALPVLQLDIAGGYYDPITQTIVASGSPFTLTAILTPKTGSSLLETAALLADTYYISAAILPQTQPTAAGDPAIGTFAFNGTTYNATADMTYGTPPIELYESLQGSDPGDLARHSIFPTYFSEFAFNFSPLNTTTSYNTADHPGGLQPGGTGSYYASFTVDTSLLNAPNVLHFDLYSTNYLTQIRRCSSACTDVDIDTFAPFSHDAQSGGTRQVPEVPTLAMLGLAVGMAAFQFRRLGGNVKP